MNPTIARKRANTQNAGAKAERKLNRQQKKAQTNMGSFRPNLSEMLLIDTLPAINPAKITEVDTNPNEPRSHTRSNCKNDKKQTSVRVIHKCNGSVKSAVFLIFSVKSLDVFKKELKTLLFREAFLY